jgi:signal transduction histidine kinase/HD-like signal output (HDOD) protein
VGQVVRIIESDPALAARILGLCRKADKGLGNRITTVRHAVVMLGVDAVRGAALSVSVYDLLGRQHKARAGGGAGGGDDASATSGDDAPAFDRAGFWRHTIAVACAAEQIARKYSSLGVEPDEAFLAGLLHNVGKLVLELVLPRAYDKVVRLAERRASDCAPLERTLLGVDHHTAGMRICEHWGLPDALGRVAWLYGRAPQTLAHEDQAPLIGVVTLAKALCRELHMGWSGDFGPAPSSHALCAELGVAPASLDAITAPLHTAVADRLAVLGLDEATTPKLMLESLTNANRQLSRLNAAMRERAAQAVSQAAVLEAIAAFHTDLRAARSLSEVAAAVIASARRAMGEGFYAMLIQDAQDARWQLLRFDDRARFTGSTLLDPPPGAKGMALANLADSTQFSLGMMGLLPWLGDELADAADPRTLKLTPLLSGDSGDAPRSSRSPGSSCGVVLVNDRDFAATTLGGVSARLGQQTLLSTWGAALSSVLDRERLRRQSEELGNAARTIAEAQQRAAHAEALARLGQVTAGAAHEMNNPLAIVSGRAQLLLTRLDNPKDRAAAQSIADAAMRMSELISSLHLLAEPVPVKPDTVALAPLLRKAVDAARARVSAARDVDVQVHRTPEAVRIDPALFVDALGELVANALEACPTGPVSVAASPEPGARVGTTPRLIITVRDTGPGMSAKALHHAFDPFFSEKPAGRQRGLGLTRARRIAEALGGDIILDSVQGRGTTATLVVRAAAA